MDWLFEGHLTVYLALAVAAAVLLVLWWGDRKERWLWLLLVPAGLALLYLLLDVAIETRHESIRRKLHEMAAAVKTRDTAAIIRHLSPAFRWGAANREQFRKLADDFFRDPVVDEMTIWEVRPDAADPNRVMLKAKPRGGRATGAEYFLVRTTWTKDADGQWRMTGFTVHLPYSDSDAPIDIPNLPR